MTKKKNEQRHIQNRSWEKDRRDRLNITFDQLSQLLPEYQPKANFSKIEILQKSIVYIEDLRAKLKDVLATKNASILKTQEDLEDSLKTLVKQKNELVVLLEKANVKVPCFVTPKPLSFIGSVTDSRESQSDTTGDPSAVCNASPTKHNVIECDSQAIGKAAGDTNVSPLGSSAADADKVNGVPGPGDKSAPKKLSILPDEGEIKKFGSVDVIAVANGSQLELKPHEQPVKNSVEITAVPTVPAEAAPLLPQMDDATLLITSTNSTSPNGCGRLTTSVQPTKAAEGVSPRPGQSSARSLAPANISAAESTAILEVNGKSCANDAHDATVLRASASDSAYNVGKHRESEPAVFQSVESKLMTYIDTKSAMGHSNAAVDKLDGGKNVPKLPPDNMLAAKASMEPPMKELHMAATSSHDDATANVHEKDLDDELFESFRLSQTPNESNPNALSPTAAFLLSFPVVSATLCAKPTEADNNFTSTSLLRLDEKTSQPKEHSLLESISSFDFTFNDLNDVADGKHISNQDIADDGQFAYAVAKGRSMDLADDAGRSKHKRSYESHGKQINAAHSNNENNKNEKNIQMHGDTKVPGSVEPRKASYTSDFLAASSSHDYPYTKQYTTLTKASDSMAVAAPAENFYSSLSSLGLPHKPIMPATTSMPPATTHFNFQKMSTLTQSQPTIADARPPLLADPPQFTFSLPKPGDTAYAPKSQPPIDAAALPLSSRTDGRAATKKSTHVKHSVSERLVTPAESTVPRCTEYNPFAFDNPTVLSTSSALTLGNLMTTPSSSTMSTTPFSFTLTPSYTSMPSTTSMLSNQEPLFSSTFDMGPLLGPSCAHAKPATNKDKAASAAHSEKDRTNASKSTRSAVATKPIKNHVNWMTSSVQSKSSTHDVDLSTNPFSTSTEEATAWTANRFIDSTSLNSFGALPQLQGDLSLNTMPTTFSSGAINGSYRNDMSADSKRHLAGKTMGPPKSGASSRAYKSRPPDPPAHPPKYAKSDRPLNSFHNFPASVSGATTVRSNGDGQTVNNFHSVSQLVDTQERQTNTKADMFYPMADDKMHAGGKDAPYHSMKPKLHDKFAAANVCGVGAGEYNANELGDKEMAANSYLFGSTKRLKLNYAACSEPYLPSNQNALNYEAATPNDIQAPYGNYQSYEQECATGTGSFSNSNLGNQAFSHQYGQAQPYHQQQQQQQQQQQFHAPQTACETVEPLPSQSYFQAAGPLSSYKPAGLSAITSKATTTANHSTYAAMSVATSKPGQSEPQTKTSSATANLSHSTNHSIQALNKSSHRGPNSARSTHYMGAAAPAPPPPPVSVAALPTVPAVPPANNFNNINNIALNQPWNDSFSWMPYTNHTYNSQLFTNDTNAMKPNSSTTNTNTIPNFNLTTIFPDCNKS